MSAIKTDGLLGLEFDMEHQNCWQLMCAAYALNYDIELTDYACPTNWWSHGLNLYADLAEQEGFKVFNGPAREWQPGDLIVMAIGAKIGNHIGMLMPGNKMLHHIVSRRSEVISYGGTYRDNTVAVYRHPGVSKFERPVVDLKEILPLHVRRRLENA